jgi:hypothetical protein
MMDFVLIEHLWPSLALLQSMMERRGVDDGLECSIDGNEGRAWLS